MGQIYFEFGNSWNQWQVTIGSKLQLDRAIHLCELTLSYARYYLMHNCIIWCVWIRKYLQNCFKCLH